MANKLNNAQIAALLSQTVGNLKPGNLDDLRQALDSRFSGVDGLPDHVRGSGADATLGSLLPTTTTSTTTTTTSTTTTTTTTHTTTSTT